MDTRSLTIWLRGVVLIGIGLPLSYVARYLSAPEDKRKQKARDLKVIAIIWMAAGVMIYHVVLIVRLTVKP